ncbi:MAG TPA: DUF1194 domain-containing protein [Alphaproteobacteria bacterium]|nr:DUF1194 domain-containing protein [Alphaproteobacteria bacterium]
MHSFMRRVAASLAGVFLFAFAAAAETVDLELVLAVDVSRSVDDEEAALQREGYAEAFLHPAVINAIQSNANRRIAVAYVEWAGTHYQKLTIPWTIVGDADSGARFSAMITSQPRVSERWTSISGAIDFSMRVLAISPYQGTRRVIDISGDGVNNNGRPASQARDEALAQGVTINGLVIMNDRPTPGFSEFYSQPALDVFYREQVIGGPGAFVIAIEDFSSFAYAIRNKLIREIASANGEVDVAAAMDAKE